MGYSGFLTTKNLTGGTIEAQDLDDRFASKAGITGVLPTLRMNYYAGVDHIGGDYTWNCPIGITKILIYGCGGGGGGGGATTHGGSNSQGSGGWQTLFMSQTTSAVLFVAQAGYANQSIPKTSWGGVNTSGSSGIWSDGGNSSFLNSLNGGDVKHDGDVVSVSDPIFGYFTGERGYGGIAVDDNGGGGGGGASAMFGSIGGAGGAGGGGHGGHGRIGGGGGGAGNGGNNPNFGGGGGASGITKFGWVDVVPGQNYTVRLGNGGLGATTESYFGGNGGAGGLSIYY